jgi:DNA polymerase I-like protein with 3'-5' exonuclease and polymerase domains
MVDGNYAAVTSSAKFTQFVDKLIADGKPFGFDIESGYTGEDATGTALLTAHPRWILVGFSFTNSTNWARYVPIAHDSGDNIDDVVQAARDFWRLLNSGLGVAHNASFELRGISRWFLEVLKDDPEVGEAVTAAKGFFPLRSDTMIEAHMAAVYPPANGPGGVGIGLKGVTFAAFGHKMTEFMDLFPDEDTDMGPATKKLKKKYVRFNTRNLVPKVINYACEDAVWCLAIHEKHYDELIATQGMILKTELAVLPVLVEMEIEGLALDWKTIHDKTSETLEFRDLMNEDIQAQLSERLGETININLASVPQLSHILYERLGLPVKERSKVTEKPSTSEKALRAIAKIDPVIKSILEYREVNKLHGSYLKKYDTELNYAGTNRAHPSHNQVGTVTGRLSVDGVSYQQWPKPYHYELRSGRTFDLNYRDLLISPPGYRIVGYDFSQVELRVLAGMADERAMLEAFASGVDIHVATAANMMNIPIKEVTKKQRAVGKTLNFAVVYGSGPANIAELISTPENPVTTEEAKELLSKYFAAFPGLKKWMDLTTAHGREEGFVHTKFGRKFTVWEYKSDNDYIRSKGDRMCVNAPVQGGAADYMKIGMVRVNRAIKRAGLQDKIRLIMTVHDALEFYVHESVSTQTVIDLVNPQVSFPVEGLPEIRADWHEGKTWGSVVEIKTDDNKQITHYMIEDDDTIYPTIEDAYRVIEGPTPEPAPKEVIEKVLDEDEDPGWFASEEFRKVPPPIVTVRLVDSPTKEIWDKFMDYMYERQETDATYSVVKVVLPDGELELDGYYKLGNHNQPDVSLILGGASIAEGVQANEEEMMEGLSL